MAATKRTKANLEFLLVKAEVKGIPEKGLLRSRNIGQVDLIWPRTGVAKKSGAREMVFKRGVSGWAGEEVAERRFERWDTAYSPRVPRATIIFVFFCVSAHRGRKRGEKGVRG